MPARFLAAGLIAALTLTAAPKIHAADLYGENYDPPADAQAYDDPPPRGDRYEQGYAEPLPPGPERYTERTYEYRGPVRDDPGPPPSRYDDQPYRADNGCVPRWQIKRRLHEDGWADLQQPYDRGGPTVLVRARREQSGRMFTLEVDRCSGAVVDARPRFLRAFGAYDSPRWGRPY